MKKHTLNQKLNNVIAGLSTAAVFSLLFFFYLPMYIPLVIHAPYANSRWLLTDVTPLTALNIIALFAMLAGLFSAKPIARRLRRGLEIFGWSQVGLWISFWLSVRQVSEKADSAGFPLRAFTFPAAYWLAWPGASDIPWQSWALFAVNVAFWLAVPIVVTRLIPKFRLHPSLQYVVGAVGILLLNLGILLLQLAYD